MGKEKGKGTEKDLDNELIFYGEHFNRIIIINLIFIKNIKLSFNNNLKIN